MRILENFRKGVKTKKPLKLGFQELLFDFDSAISSPTGNRTPVTRMKTWRPNH